MSTTEISKHFDPSVKQVVSNLAKALDAHGLPVTDDPDFYPKHCRVPYVAVGDVDYEKLSRAHNRVFKYIYAKNKAAISKIRGLLREFYKSHKNVKSANKIMVIVSPDDCFSIRLVNRGFKTINPYVVLDKEEKGDKKGLKSYRDKIEDYRTEFSKFLTFLRGRMNLSQKSKMDKIKGDSDFQGVVANVGFALSAMALKKEQLKVVQCYYDDEHKTFPFLELKALAQKSAKEALNRVIIVHKNKNARHYAKLAKLLTKFYNKTDVKENNRLIAGLPAKYGCVKNTCTDYNDMLGVFGIYNMGMTVADKEKIAGYIEEAKLFTEFLNKQK